MTRKHNLQLTLQILAHVFESSAKEDHIEEFKMKYKGVNWHNGIEQSLLRYANTSISIERWIENLTVFMVEKETVLCNNSSNNKKQ